MKSFRICSDKAGDQLLREGYSISYVNSDRDVILRCIDNFSRDALYWRRVEAEQKAKNDRQTEFFAKGCCWASTEAAVELAVSYGIASRVGVGRLAQFRAQQEKISAARLNANTPAVAADQATIEPGQCGETRVSGETPGTAAILQEAIA